VPGEGRGPDQFVPGGAVSVERQRQGRPYGGALGRHEGRVLDQPGDRHAGPSAGRLGEPDEVLADHRIPAGILCGRLAWRVFADQLGIVPAPVVPLPTLGVLVPAALALALAIAAVPGESAARARPAQILRSE
jgi:hypothetical protein